MIYLFYGEDTSKGRKKAREIFESLRAKKPDASFGELLAEGLVPEKLEELCGGQGLFENKCVVFCDGIFSDMLARDIAEPFIDSLAESTNIFILFEPSLTKALLTKIEKKSEKTQEFSDKAPESAKKNFNIFSLADAVAGRKAESAWIIYREAIERGLVPEEIHGTIFWQIKSIMLAASSGSPVESKLSPFVYMKAKSAAKNFSLVELSQFSNNLVSMYHDAHRGKNNFELELEKFLLTI